MFKPLQDNNVYGRLDAMRLARVAGVGPINFSRLLCQYGSATAALEALPERMRRAGRCDAPLIPSRESMAADVEWLEQRGGRVLLRTDADYPLLLSHVPDAPPVLFAQGDIRKLSSRGVGVVGARNASSAGIRMAQSLAADIVGAGLCVISGLARGIDSAAHEAALHRELTVAAVAGGLDHVYPPENARLQAAIAERGCLLTEAPLGTIPQARHFPRRNRLIAGLGLGCVIVEAARYSGTLITADLAQNYNRTLFAVPGSPLDPRSRGGNALLRNGAVLTESAEDVLSELPPDLPGRLPAPWENTEKNAGRHSGFSEPARRWGHAVTPRENDWSDPDVVIEQVRQIGRAHV